MTPEIFYELFPSDNDNFTGALSDGSHVFLYWYRLLRHCPETLHPGNLPHTGNFPCTSGYIDSEIRKLCFMG